MIFPTLNYLITVQYHFQCWNQCSNRVIYLIYPSVGFGLMPIVVGYATHQAVVWRTHAWSSHLLQLLGQGGFPSWRFIDDVIPDDFKTPEFIFSSWFLAPVSQYTRRLWPAKLKKGIRTSVQLMQACSPVALGKVFQKPFGYSKVYPWTLPVILPPQENYFWAVRKTPILPCPRFFRYT